VGVAVLRGWQEPSQLLAGWWGAAGACQDGVASGFQGSSFL